MKRFTSYSSLPPSTLDPPASVVGIIVLLSATPMLLDGEVELAVDMMKETSKRQEGTEGMWREKGKERREKKFNLDHLVMVEAEINSPAYKNPPWPQ